MDIKQPAMDQEKKPAAQKTFPPARREPVRDSSLEELFRRLRVETGDSREEKLSDVLDTVQRVVLQMDSAESAGPVAEAQEGRTCQACGGQNSRENRFCARCGVPLMDAAEKVEAAAGSVRAETAAPGQHHYHHHYHHHYFATSEGVSPSVAPEQRSAATSPIAREQTRPRPSTGGSGPSRAEAAVRKLAQDWALACNTKHLDDIVDLYSPDAMVIRPNVPPVRSLAAIREYFFSVLEAGLGEVEMETTRIELFGDIAYDIGRCTMLVPSATGKRREERGKYVLFALKQSGEWKLAVDCWTTDLSLTADSAVSPPVSRNPAKSA